jgi:hypothetical protein
MARTPSYYGGRNAFNSRLTRDHTPADIRDVWSRAPAPAPPPPAPALPPPDPALAAYLATLRRLFAPRQRVPLPAARHYPIPSTAPCATGCGRAGLFRTEDGPDDHWLCHNCLVASGVMPRRAPQPEPMSEAEIARRREQRRLEEAVRRWRGDPLEWDRAQPIFLAVPHRQDDGLTVAKMVGKLDLVNVAMIQALRKDLAVAAPTGDWRDLADGPREVAFFHAHTASQRHHKLDCPAPLDTVVADFLARNDVGWVCCYERREDDHGRRAPGVLRLAPTRRLRFAPEAEYDGRWRVYLPEDQWERLAGVREHRRRDGSILLHVGAERELILESPWIPQDRMLVLRRGKKWRPEE